MIPSGWLKQQERKTFWGHPRQGLKKIKWLGNRNNNNIELWKDAQDQEVVGGNEDERPAE